MTTTINASTSAGLVNTADTSGVLQLQTANTTAVTIDTSQNVGIGTASPSSSQVGPTLQLGSAAGVTNSRGNLRLAHTDTSLGNSRAFDLYVNNTDDFTIKDGNSGTVVLAVQKSTLGGNIQFNSGYGSIATAYGCRAWAQFNGVGPSIRGSGNISSITSPATGTYILNFTTAMPDANYSIVGNHSNPSGGVIGLIVDSSNGGGVNPSTSSFQIYCTQGSGGSGVNPTYVNIAVFR